MAYLFGKKKKTTAPTPQDTLDNINKTIEDLHKKEEYYDKQILGEEKKAREFMKKNNKKRALECMRRKKLIEKSRDNVSAMSFNLEQQKIKVQEMQTTSNVFKTYMQTSETMKRQFGEVDIDKIEDIMDDIQDMNDNLDEVNSLLTKPVGDMDEDELDAELEALMGEEETTQPTATTTTVHETPQTVQADDDEEQLEQLMGNFV
ncbi:Charged multivesicular body protein 4a [Histomonas meleagridis]|uniref:Charged multivesicular body protein 4a n=1 Tax=Histomonas meleagridis TaxID=135588 RepID=UPI00355A9B7E|nr:Charged multivesicular body protein 4a [Histomonas meleagridis]KAH0803245.1 Charged multivesicular body protein 4a [Histomonas meleagridis]